MQDQDSKVDTQEQGTVTLPEHVAWLRFRRSSTSERPAWLQLCDSSDEGAFPVYRESSLATLRAERDEAVSDRDDLRCIQQEQWDVLTSVGPITCRNGVKHSPEENCLYCRAGTAESARDAYRAALFEYGEHGLDDGGVLALRTLEQHK